MGALAFVGTGVEGYFQRGILNHVQEMLKGSYSS